MFFPFQGRRPRCNSPRPLVSTWSMDRPTRDNWHRRRAHQSQGGQQHGPVGRFLASGTPNQQRDAHHAQYDECDLARKRASHKHSSERLFAARRGILKLGRYDEDHTRHDRQRNPKPRPAPARRRPLDRCATRPRNRRAASAGDNVEAYIIKCECPPPLGQRTTNL